MDPAQMEQALINVLKNAVEAAGDGGAVTVRLGRDGDGRGVIEIEDSGPGIATRRARSCSRRSSRRSRTARASASPSSRRSSGGTGSPYALDGPKGGPTRFRITLG